MSVSCTCSASPGKPRRMSVWPVASQTRTPLGTGIIGGPKDRECSSKGEYRRRRQPAHGGHSQARSRCGYRPGHGHSELVQDTAQHCPAGLNDLGLLHRRSQVAPPRQPKGTPVRPPLRSLHPARHPASAEQKAWLNPMPAGNRGNIGAWLRRLGDNPPLLLFAPAPPWVGNDRIPPRKSVSRYRHGHSSCRDNASPTRAVS